MQHRSGVVSSEHSAGSLNCWIATEQLPLVVACRSGVTKEAERLGIKSPARRREPAIRFGLETDPGHGVKCVSHATAGCDRIRGSGVQAEAQREEAKRGAEGLRGRAEGFGSIGAGARGLGREHGA